MMKSIAAALVAISLLAASACNRQVEAADPISGTWKADLASVQIEEKPDVLLLKNGQYSCSSCTPPIDVKADGQFQPAAGSDYYDSIAVKQVDDRTVNLVRRKGDRVVNETTLQVAPDGNTLSFNYKNTSVPNAPAVTGNGTQTRVGTPAAGAHAISGTWQNVKLENVSEEGMTVTFRREGDTLHMSSPNGESYVAKLDGSETPVQGDIGGTLVSVQRIGDNGIRETFKRKGKVVGVGTLTVGEDGRMQGSYESHEDGSKTRWVAQKQS